MDSSALIREIQGHLQDIRDDPSRKLDEKLLESVNSHVTEAIDESQRDILLNQLSELLSTLQQDPTLVTNLIQVLLSSSHPYDFSRVLSINPTVDFVAGLTSPLPPINLIALALLEKATYRTSDIGIVAGKPEIVGALVRLWLCTQNTAVATRAHEVLLALLQADVPATPATNGSAVVYDGLLWRRMFRDKDIYGSLFSICSLATAGQDGQPSKRDKTVAQARLLDLLLCIDSEPVRGSQITEVEEQYGVKKGGGLLYFAAIQMVDYQDDVLMHMTLMDFYAKLLSLQHSIVSSAEREGASLEKSSSYALNFLQDTGIHKRTMDYYLHPEMADTMDLTYLYGPSANYVSVYVSTYPQNVLRHQDLVASILARLANVLSTVSPGQWAQGETPKHDLHVIASIPRQTLIPRNRDSPLFSIPPKSASPDTYNTLAHIFHGSTDSFIADPSSSDVQEDEAAARALYFLYMEQFPLFWSYIIKAADTVAMKDVALSAIALTGAVITAKWTALPEQPPSDSSPFPLPTESSLTEKCQTYGVQLPRSGIEAIMSEPAIGIVVPYLMKPAQTFSNLVGGGRGDVESAAYRVAVAKHDALTLLHQKLKDWVGSHSDAQEMVATVGRRVAQGPMGGTSEVGGRVGTLEL